MKVIEKMKNERRVTLCGRVSTSLKQSPEMQMRELREYCRNRGWKVTGEFVDSGISGAKDSRPQLDRLMADAHRRRRRYASSRANLLPFFGGGKKLSDISAARIEEFKRDRRATGIKAATLNRDLRFLAQVLKQAARERFIARNPFDTISFFLNESRERREPYILTWEEQEKLLAVAPPRIRILTVLGVETGMRTGEMLNLKWDEIDFFDKPHLRIEKSKTPAGIRTVPLSPTCVSELSRWRSLLGPSYSDWVFPSLSNRRHRLQGGRKAWASALRKAGISSMATGMLFFLAVLGFVSGLLGWLLIMKKKVLRCTHCSATVQAS